MIIIKEIIGCFDNQAFLQYSHLWTMVHSHEYGGYLFGRVGGDNASVYG